MSFWCDVRVYVPVANLGPALAAVARFAVPERKGAVTLQLPAGQVTLPRLGAGRAAALPCRSVLKLAEFGTFWFAVDEVLRDEESGFYESEGLPLPVETRDGVDCLPITNIRFIVTCGCRFAELAFSGQNNSASRELDASESVHERFEELAEEIGAVAAMVFDTDRPSIDSLDGDRCDFDWRPFGDQQPKQVDDLAEAVALALGTPVPPVVPPPVSAEARRLAEAITKSGDFASLPVLADALEEAGCADAFLLGHARAGLRHGKKGCRVADLVLKAGR